MGDVIPTRPQFDTAHPVFPAARGPLTDTLLVLVLLVALCRPSPVAAGPITLGWDPAPRATSYDVEQSIDGGATWAVARTVALSACTGTPARCTVAHVAPSTGFVLFRFVAVNANGRTIRSDAGAWHCEACAPPPATVNVGAQ